jgi:hypothetical protein
MLSSVLRSERAIAANVAIMRAFVRMREVLATHEELAKRLTALERRIDSEDETIVEIVQSIRQLMATPPRAPEAKRRPIGLFRPRRSSDWKRERCVRMLRCKTCPRCRCVPVVAVSPLSLCPRCRCPTRSEHLRRSCFRRTMRCRTGSGRIALAAVGTRRPVERGHPIDCRATGRGTAAWSR